MTRPKHASDHEEVAEYGTLLLPVIQRAATRRLSRSRGLFALQGRGNLVVPLAQLHAIPAAADTGM